MHEKPRGAEDIGNTENRGRTHVQEKTPEHQSIRSTCSPRQGAVILQEQRTMEHADRMASLAKSLGNALGLNEADMDALS